MKKLQSSSEILAAENLHKSEVGEKDKPSYELYPLTRSRLHTLSCVIQLKSSETPSLLAYYGDLFITNVSSAAVGNSRLVLVASRPAPRTQI